jgi:hypothetical protein
MHIKFGDSLVFYENCEYSMQYLKSIFAKDNKLKERTINNYVSRINRLAILATNQTYRYTNDYFLQSRESILIKLEHSDLKNKKMYLNAVEKFNKSRHWQI